MTHLKHLPFLGGEAFLFPSFPYSATTTTTTTTTDTLAFGHCKNCKYKKDSNTHKTKQKNLKRQKRKNNNNNNNREERMRRRRKEGRKEKSCCVIVVQATTFSGSNLLPLQHPF